MNRREAAATISFDARGGVSLLHQPLKCGMHRLRVLDALERNPISQIMDGIAEVIARVVGEIVREIFEALFRTIFGQIGRFIGFVYNGIYQTVRWNLKSDILATPVANLVMLALGGASFFALVKAIQRIIA